MLGIAVSKPFELGAVALTLVGCTDPRGSSLERQRLERRASYPLGLPPAVWGGERRLVASDAAEFDQFGYSVSLADDHALLGAYGEGSYRGAGYVFSRSDSDWAEAQKLAAADGAEGDQFGWSVALGEERVLLGAPGHESSRGAAYLFVRDGSFWVEEQKFVASDGAEGDQLGWSVALGEDRALLGAPGHESSRGAAYLFVWDGDSWMEEQRLAAGDAAVEDRLGWSVALFEDRALLGAPGTDDAQGAALVFTRSDDAWGEEQQLVAGDAAAGDEFGISVALGEDRALVGSYWDEALRGAAYVFHRSNGSWNEEQKLGASDGAEGDRFGIASALVQERALIGAYAYDGGRGAAYSFVRSDGSWGEEQKLVASGTTENTLFGWSLSLIQNRALVGAHYDDNLRGAAHVFSLGLANGARCSAAADCASGHCADEVCCDVDCTGACAACAVSEGAAVDGSCLVFPAGAEGSPACGTLGCNGQSLDCVACESDEHCPGTRYCAADQTCQPRTDQGETCSGLQGGAGSCGEAMAVNGSFCATGETCASGHCVDGVCCDTTCAGACEACTAALKGKGKGEDGTCGHVAAGLNPVKSAAEPSADCPENAACPVAPSCNGRGACECTTEPDDGAGCACRAGGSPARGAGGWLAAALGLWLLGRRHGGAACHVREPIDLDPMRPAPAVRAGRG